MILFTTRSCSIRGTCRTWIPALEKAHPDLRVVYDYAAPLGLRERAAGALAQWCLLDGVDRNEPWVYDEEKGRVGFPAEDGEGTVWR